MDDISNRWRSDAGRETRRDMLLRRLAQTLDELRLIGVAGPAALEDLLDRNRPPRPPAH
jgi:hypothetical protein